MKYHYDRPNNKWNVFQIIDGHEIFIQAFDTLEEEKDFISINNWK